MANQNIFCALKAGQANAEQAMIHSFDGPAISYADMLRASGKVAAALRALGLSPGDRVSVQVEKSVANLCLYLGVLQAGLVYHPLNTAYATEEIQFFLADAQPDLFICDPSRYDDYAPLLSDLNIGFIYTLDGSGEGSFTDLFSACAADYFVEPRNKDDLAALLYSSGTTGKPKGIMLSHDNLLSNASVLVATWGFSESDCLIHALPIYHVHGLFVAIHCVLLSGASMYWLPTFTVNGVLKCLPMATAMMGVPTYYTRLLSDARLTRERCSTMRLFISGSAPLLEETFYQFADRTGHPILERYGMTETGMNSSNPLVGERRAGTVGMPLPGTDIRICNADHNPMGAGEVGEIEVRGPNVFRGYWRMPDKTASDFTADGWFVTGDQGFIDQQGYLSIVGRSKDMVITGGLNVYPKEVELVLNSLPGVSESAVFGVPHQDFGEAVVAVVVPLPDAQLDVDDMRSMLGKRLAAFKVPKKLELRVALPRNAMGKVQKNLLREDWALKEQRGQSNH